MTQMPSALFESQFFSMSQSREELSLVCSSDLTMPEGALAQSPGWKSFQIQGILAFELVGILAQLAGILSDAAIAIFAISTFNTDYILVQTSDCARSMAALKERGINLTMDLDYKIRHEAFVANHTGTTPQEILAIGSILPMSVSISGLVALLLQPQSLMAKQALEFGLTTLPLLLSLTWASEHYEFVFLVAIGLLFILLASNQGDFNGRRLPYITSYRSAMLLTTALCILGVDFQIFPRRFAKAETFGFGLMDIGILSAMIFLYLPVQGSWWGALACCLIHELSLVLYSYEWIQQEGARDDIVNANREGIVSSPGYLAIHLAGVAWGLQFAKLKSTLGDHLDQLKRLVLWSLVMWASLVYSSQELFHPVSRRFVNWNYFNWMIAFNLTLIALFIVSDVLIFLSKPKDQKAKESKKKEVHKPLMSKRVPSSLEAMNFNGLFYFLLANVLTGLVNFSLRPMEMATQPALGVLGAYVLLLQGVSHVLYSAQLQIKAW
eukprot:maker-scaffold248_size238799-snap-gene-1.22 protein:Tk02155 transcript:maker-scaffold248_size238799-snap-gene-1.22-mRNA-1 annotation:"GM14174"